MKNLFRTLILASVFIGTLSFTSCKKQEATTETSSDTIPEEGMSSVPVADTVITDKDTVVEMGPANDLRENPTGEQVP